MSSDLVAKTPELYLFSITLTSALHLSSIHFVSIGAVRGVPA